MWWKYRDINMRFIVLDMSTATCYMTAIHFRRCEFIAICFVAFTRRFPTSFSQVFAPIESSAPTPEQTTTEGGCWREFLRTRARHACSRRNWLGTCVFILSAHFTSRHKPQISKSSKSIRNERRCKISLIIIWRASRNTKQVFRFWVEFWTVVKITTFFVLKVFLLLSTRVCRHPQRESQKESVASEPHRVKKSHSFSIFFLRRLILWPADVQKPG